MPEKDWCGESPAPGHFRRARCAVWSLRRAFAECLTTLRECDNNGKALERDFRLQPVQRFQPESSGPIRRVGFPLGRTEWISRKTTSKKTTSCRGWKKKTSWAGT